MIELTPQLDLRAPADIAEAISRWKANCGPTAIAAATGRSMAEIRHAVPPIASSAFRGYMDVSDIRNALRWLDVRIARSWSGPPNSLLLSELGNGPAIFMLQFGGPWARDPRAAARHRHVVAFHRGWTGSQGDRWIGDVNTDGTWSLLAVWLEGVLPFLLPEDGDETWSIGWACQIN